MNRFGVSGPVHPRNLAVAVQELERYAGVKIEAIIPLEPGGRNTPNPLSSGARLGIPIVDGDYAGRAIPEIVQITPCIAGYKPWPATSVDPFGNAVIIREAINPPMAERIGKYLAVAAFGTVGMAGFLMPAKEARKLVVTGTASRSLSVGSAIREAREAGRDPVDAAAKASGALLFFKGAVSERKWEDRDGYMFGENTVSGTDEFSGRTLRIWFKNENHITWLDDVSLYHQPGSDFRCRFESWRTTDQHGHHKRDAGQCLGTSGRTGVKDRRGPESACTRLVWFRHSVSTL